MFHSSSRSRRGVLPGHYPSRSKDTKSKRLAAAVRLLVILACLVAAFVVGKRVLQRGFHIASGEQQAVALSQHHSDQQPCTDELCTAEDHKHAFADIAARVKDKPFTLQRAGAASGLYSMAIQDMDGQSYALDSYAGKVALVTNVASQCGYTDSNYKGLQRLYEKYHAQGFEVLAFPCNQFGEQEPGSLADVRAFARDKYHITFPLFPKVEVNGQNEHAIFKYLKDKLPGHTTSDMLLSWNFNKFLVSRHGLPVKHYQSAFDEAELEQDIEAELKASATGQASS